MRFEDLRESLLKGGIAPRHVCRYVRELDEHLDDLAAQQRAAGYDGEDAAIRARARLGSDTELASAMLAQKQFRSLAARAPWAVFGLLPPVLAVAVMMVPTVCLVLIAKHFGFQEKHALPPPDWFRTLAQSVMTGTNLLVVPLAAELFVIVAARQRLGLAWPLVTTALLLILFVHSEALFATPGHPGNALRVGLTPVFLSGAWRVIAVHWPVVTAQYLLTLLPALWFARRTVRQ
jgi:hypothetical protein